MYLSQKLDSLKSRYGELSKRSADNVNNMEEALPMVVKFHEAHNELEAWIKQTEPKLKSKELTGPLAEEKIQASSHRFGVTSLGLSSATCLISVVCTENSSYKNE